MPPQGYAQDMSNQPNVHELRDVLNDVDFPVDKSDTVVRPIDTLDA